MVPAGHVEHVVVLPTGFVANAAQLVHALPLSYSPTLQAVVSIMQQGSQHQSIATVLSQNAVEVATAAVSTLVFNNVWKAGGTVTLRP